MKSLRLLISLVLALSLAACLKGLLPKAEQSAVFALPAPVAMQAKQPLSGALLVDTPSALAPLDGTAIVVIRSDGEVQLLPGVRWIAPAPQMLQDLIARQIEAAAAAPSVAQTAQSYRLPLRLSSDLRAFEAVDDGTALRVRAELVLRLICTQDARVIATSPPITVNAAPVPKQAMATTAALRDAAAILARQVVFWLDKVDSRGCAP